MFLYVLKGLTRRVTSLTLGFLILVMTSYILFNGYRYVIKSITKDLTSTLKGNDEVIAYSFKDTRLTRFDVRNANLKYLKNFKSPCFLEKLHDDLPPSDWSVYATSAYVLNQDYTKREKFGVRVEREMYNRPQGVLMDDEYNICGKQGKCRIRCLPHFMLLGMAKSGTSDFFSRMKTHPLVYTATNKELFYWTQYRFQINATIGDYSDLFDNSLNSFLQNPNVDRATGKKYYPYALGDFTSVTFTDDVWWRDHPGNKGLLEPKYLKIHDLHSVIPNIKLVAILRNPSTRLYSSYNMFKRMPNQSSPEDFHLRVVKSIEWWHNCTVLKGLPRRRCAYGSPPEMPPVVCVLKNRNENNRWYGQVNVANYSGEIRRGMYAIFVKDWYSVFPKEQILLLKTEEYSQNTLEIFNNEVLPFLDLPTVSESDETKLDKDSHSNARAYLPMLPETRKLLDDFYKPFNEELAEFLGDDKWLWND